MMWQLMINQWLYFTQELMTCQLSLQRMKRPGWMSHKLTKCLILASLLRILEFKKWGSKNKCLWVWQNYPDLSNDPYYLNLHQKYFISILYINDNSWSVVSCKHSNNLLLLLIEVSKDYRRKHWWPFFVSHLPIFIVSPLHYVSNVQKSNTMASPTPKLLHRNFLFLTFDFLHKIG